MTSSQAEPAAETAQAQTLFSSRPPAEPGQRAFPPYAIPTEHLFRGSQEILINHQGEHYRLRITKNGKLILTK